MKKKGAKPFRCGSEVFNLLKRSVSQNLEKKRKQKKDLDSNQKAIPAFYLEDLQDGRDVVFKPFKL